MPFCLFGCERNSIKLGQFCKLFDPKTQILSNIQIEQLLRQRFHIATIYNRAPSNESRASSNSATRGQLRSPLKPHHTTSTLAHYSSSTAGLPSAVDGSDRPTWSLHRRQFVVKVCDQLLTRFRGRFSGLDWTADWKTLPSSSDPEIPLCWGW